MNFYTETVPFEIAVELKKAGYWNPDYTYDSSYNGPCYFIKDKKYYKDGLIASLDDIVPAPTYAHIYDWLIMNNIIPIIYFDNDMWVGKIYNSPLEFRSLYWFRVADFIINEGIK